MKLDRKLLVAAIVLLLVGASVGYALRAWLDADPGPHQVASDATVASSAAKLEAEVARLRTELEAQREQRSQLAEKFQQLRDDALELAAAYQEEYEAGPAASGGEALPGPAGRPAHELPAAQPQQKGVSLSALRAAGFGEVEAARIKERIENIVLRQLYLTDAAKREGWKKTPRFSRAHSEIGAEFDQMREEYGEDSFDWILFSAGRRNRVVVDSILGESAAERVGLAPGDLLLAYDDERVFTGAELRKLTVEGLAGELIVLEFERKGVPQRVYLPRGPLGIQLHNATLPPSS